MHYFDPPELTKDMLQKANISKVLAVPVRPESDSLPLSCLENVKRFIARNGDGEVQFGWIFSVIGNVALKLTAHAVVKKTDGTLLCVTPNEYRVGNLKFAPDDNIEQFIQNYHLPLKFVPLVKSDALESYICLEIELDNLRLKNAGVVAQSEIQTINLRASMLLPDIIALAQKHTGRNDICYCGSGKKSKRCCSKK